MKLAESSNERSGLADDLLYGVDAIARELGWKKPNGDWNLRRVYHARETGALPIRRDKGLKIYAFRSELRQALLKESSLPGAQNGKSAGK